LDYDVLAATVYDIALGVRGLNCECVACLHASGIFDTAYCERDLLIRVCRRDKIESNLITLDRLNLLLSSDLNFV
jgi:hypothetical protein